MVSFSDTSTNSPTRWSWNFGDGTGSSSQNPVKIYTTAGNYTVILTAANTGGSSSSSQTVSIYSLPAASFTESASSGVAPLTIDFTDTSTGNIVGWLWNFGDGSTSAAQNPSKTYTICGTYAVTLTASNPAGAGFAGATKQVYSAPVAVFAASATSASPGAVINFTDQSTGNVTGWSWNFGDGGGSSSQNPARSYTSTGNYTVSLTASNPAGSNTLTKAGYITVTSAALTLSSEIALLQGVDASGYVVLSARLNRIKNTATGEAHAITDGISAYDAYVTYDAAGVIVMGVAGIAPFSSPTSTLNTSGGTRTNFAASQTGQAPVPPLTLANLRIRLQGSKNTARTVTLDFNTVSRASGGDIPQEASASLTFQRGDAKPDGAITITDSLFIAQYLAGIRGLGTDNLLVNPVNSASTKQDDVNGDKITIADALLIAQMLAGIRDDSYNLI